MLCRVVDVHEESAHAGCCKLARPDDDRMISSLPISMVEKIIAFLRSAVPQLTSHRDLVEFLLLPLSRRLNLGWRLFLCRLTSATAIGAKR